MLIVIYLNSFILYSSPFFPPPKIEFPSVQKIFVSKAQKKGCRPPNANIHNKISKIRFCDRFRKKCLQVRGRVLRRIILGITGNYYCFERGFDLDLCLQLILFILLIQMAEPQDIAYQGTFHDMDESFKGNKFTGNQEDHQNNFLKYAGGNYNRQNMDGIRSVAESHKRVTTEFSQVSNDNAFKKVKFNQLETLKELRQEYQILRNLPIQDQFVQHSHSKKHSASLYSSQRDSESVSSSQPSRKSKKHGEPSRDAQILTLEKRQLELVIGNSMKKIEELLNKQIEYKKTIHELQIQLDSKNSDDKLEELKKTLKKNESDYKEKLAAVQKENDELAFTKRQLAEKILSLQSELAANSRQFRSWRDEKRELEDLLRSEKDKRSHFELDMKRISMESEIMEKDKNNEINRLKMLLSEAPNRDNQEGTVARLEEEIRIREARYQMLLNEFQNFKREASYKPKTPQKLENNQYKMLETLMQHLREDSANQNRASMDLLASMMGKVEDAQQLQRKRSSPESGSEDLMAEVYQLRGEINRLRAEKEERQSESLGIVHNIGGFAEKIKQLETEIADGTISKENLLKEYNVIKSSYDYTKEEYERVMEENRMLRTELSERASQGNEALDGYRSQFRQRENELEEECRALRRRMDEASFQVQKSKQQAEFNLNLVRVENESNIKLMREQMNRLEQEKQNLRNQLDRMRDFYEGKIREKNALIEKSSFQFSQLQQTNEKTLVSYKSSSEQEMKELIRKIQSMATLNERYLELSNRHSGAARELHELRYSLRKLKAMNDGVDHLWLVKETEYQNINDLIRQMNAY